MLNSGGGSTECFCVYGNDNRIVVVVVRSKWAGQCGTIWLDMVDDN